MSRSSNEYTPVIVEIGARFLRAGFAGETSPSVLKSSSSLFPFSYDTQDSPNFLEFNDSSLTAEQRQIVVENTLRTDPAVKQLLDVYSNDIHKWIKLNPGTNDVNIPNDSLYNKLHEIFNTDLMVSPRRCKVILVDSKFSIAKKFAIFDILINKLKVKSVITLPDSLLTTIGSGERDAFVMDFGWESLRIDPIVDLRSISGTANEFHNDYNALTLHYRIVLRLCELDDPLINENLLKRPDLFEIIEEFIVNDLYVLDEANETMDESDNFEIVEGVNIPNRLRYELLEQMLFQNHAFYDTIESVMKNTGRDCRPVLLKSIVPTGGLANIPGFKLRLAKELKKRFPENDVLAKKTEGPWIGCSLYITTVLIKQEKAKWKELEITRDILNSLTSEKHDKGYKLSGLPDIVNSTLLRKY